MITDYIDKIFCGDSLEIMRELPDGCCDIAVTSPPYNLKNSTGNGTKMRMFFRDIPSVYKEVTRFM